MGGTVYFAPIVGDGTYSLSVVLHQTAAGGAGSEWFSTTTTNGGASTALFSSTPEPGSMVLLGSGVLGLAGVLRRRVFALIPKPYNFQMERPELVSSGLSISLCCIPFDRSEAEERLPSTCLLLIAGRLGLRWRVSMRRR